MKNSIKTKVKKKELEILMARNNIDRSRLSLLTNVGAGYITRVLNNEVPVSCKVRNRFIDIFQCNWDDIFFIEELPKG